MSPLAPGGRLDGVVRELQAVVERFETFERTYAAQLDEVHPRQRLGALNLVDYLALRQTDTGVLDVQLRELGLAPLAGAEAHAQASVTAVLAAACSLRHADDCSRVPRFSFERGRARIRRQTARLLGPREGEAPTRIMVTLPAEAATDYDLVLEMVKAGMNVARINCAHDGPEQWRSMIANVRRAAEAEGRSVPVFMDLAGPKIRIGAVAPGPRVRRIAPSRDARGRVLEPRTVWIGSDGSGSAPDRDAWLPVSSELSARLEPGSRLCFTDARDRPCELEVDAVVEGVARAACDVTLYVESGLPLALVAKDGSELARGVVGDIPPAEPRMTLRVDDVLTLHADDRPGEDPVPADAVGGPRPGHVSCTMPEIVGALRVGQAVFIDDGKVRGEVVAVRPGEADVRITRARIGGTRVKGHKGLNLPDTEIGLYGLTDKDKEDLGFVVEHADGVNVSFINHPDDVEDLLDELERVGGRHLGLVLKIETRGGVTHLPGILLAVMEWPTVGVMIARGDLAIEAGWLELAEVAEEILMLCEAAHVPTIWATEVLDRLAKKGVPARGEVSDVIMAGRAECVMLNKGPYITRAIRGLDLVLSRFQAYREKKATRLPALRLELPDPAEVGRSIGDRQGRWA